MKKLLVGATALCSILALFFLMITIHRLRLDYNEQGMYFDAESETTFSDQAVIGYAIFTLLFSVPALLMLLKLIRSK